MNNKIINITIVSLLVLFISFRLTTACGEMNNRDQVQESDPIEELPAVFTGMLPCADCPGIEMHLLIEEEGYTELSWYRDRSPDPFMTEGNWALKNDTLSLYIDNNELLKVYLYDGETITLLDHNRQQVTGELSDMYTLEKSPEEMSIRRRHDELRTEEGVRFLASGNEPFWNIRIDETDSLHYRTPETEWSAPSESTSENEDSIIWRAESQPGTLVMTATQSWCRDTMSGFLFTHTVTVQAEELGELRGCGRFLD